MHLAINDMIGKDFYQYPKFRHNLWTIQEDSDVAFLTVSHSIFEVPVEEAKKFLRIRRYLTGSNTVEDIASKSGVAVEEIKSIIQSLIDAGILHLPVRPTDDLSTQEIQEGLLSVCRLWGEQLAETNISHDFLFHKVSKSVVLGWLLETYHYVKAFPSALEYAACHAKGRLKELILEYANQEKGHERFIEQTLVKAGVSRQEVRRSIPLVSTRTIDMLMRELFEFEPFTVLLIAAIIEADEFDEAQINEFKKSLFANYGLDLETFNPFFEHVEIDAQLGHAKLLKENIELIQMIDRTKLHYIVNKIHDIKHGFDLQALEIRDYYSREGNYFPRQFVNFFSI